MFGMKMESSYRMWEKVRKQGLLTTDSAQFCRELQAALGTAKWQLEAFERATRMSHGHRCEDTTATRHNQFISAIKSQILRVEAALHEAFIEEGKQPLRWVNLDEEERDDLATFLSGTSTSIQHPSKGTPSENFLKRKEADLDASVICTGDLCERKSSTVADCIIEVKDEESSGRIDGTSSSSKQDKATSARRIYSLPNFGALKVVIDDKFDERNIVTKGIDATPKEKGSKPSFWKQKFRDNSQAKGALNLLNKAFGQVGGLQRQLPSPIQMPLRCSLQFSLVLMIAIFLIVPFVLYSS